jgi:hypothetical protein
MFLPLGKQFAEQFEQLFLHISFAVISLQSRTLRTRRDAHTHTSRFENIHGNFRGPFGRLLCSSSGSSQSAKRLSFDDCQSPGY